MKKEPPPQIQRESQKDSFSSLVGLKGVIVYVLHTKDLTLAENAGRSLPPFCFGNSWANFSWEGRAPRGLTVGEGTLAAHPLRPLRSLGLGPFAEI